MSDEERDRIEGECAEALKTTEWTGDVEPVTMDLPTPPDGPVNIPSVIDTRPTGADLEGDWMKPEVGRLRRENELLKAYLVTKGVGHAAIKRILQGEVVR